MDDLFYKAFKDINMDKNVEMPDQRDLSQHTDRSPWQLPARQATFLALFALTAGLILFLRLFQLETLQSEIYGDIFIVRDYVMRILDGSWPVKFYLSAGPFYHYLISPIVFLTGLNYAGLKLASVIVSLAGLAATYAFSRRLLNDYFALLVLFVAGVSSWLLIFSRLGNSHIAQPLLTMLALWLVVRIIQFRRQQDVVACALVSSLGLFVLPQVFILPAVIFLTLLCLGRAGHTLPQGWIKTFVVVSAICLLLFGLIVASDIDNFSTGYVGSKIRPADTGSSVLGVLGKNVINASLALHVRGDVNFRSNPSTLPHLDWVSGILFFAGIIFWLTARERRRWTPLWLVPLILLQVPSILVLSQPMDVPSASRTLGVAPIVYMLVASGIWWLVQAVYVRGKHRLALIVMGLLLGSILFLNIQRYFRTYLDGLPYYNTPIGRTIANYANLLPSNTQVYMVGCCWEKWETPDHFVQYDMIRPQNLHYIEAKELSCTWLQSVVLPAVFIWSFYDELAAPQLESCKQWLPAQLYTYQGRPVFYAAPLYIIGVMEIPRH